MLLFSKYKKYMLKLNALIKIILITVILIRFSGTIEYGGDRAQLRYEIGQILPVTIIVFTVSTIFSRVIFRGMI